MQTFDRTQLRILGVLMEKELAVPDAYPLTRNALLAACNQRNNRDPVMELEDFEVDGALLSLQLEGWVVRREGSRAPRFAHKAAERLALDPAGQAVLTELLLRGPQTQVELGTRAARMGLEGGADAALAALEALRGRGLVELLPRRPRERHPRWTHLLGAPAAAWPESEGGEDLPPARAAREPDDDRLQRRPEPGDGRQERPAGEPEDDRPERPAREPDDDRLERLERRVRELADELAALRAEIRAGRGAEG